MRTSVICMIFLLSLALQRQVNALSSPCASTQKSNSREGQFFQQPACRRDFVQQSAGSAAFAMLSWGRPTNAMAATEALRELQSTLQKAKEQLDPVPGIIEKQQWDKVRAILITPPLSDCWTTTKKGSNLLTDVANAVGDAGGDELAILEFREELLSHLRYLDMAVYNNVFNPIATEGTAGATKELVRSYYEDPKNEWNASIKALEGILTEIANATK